MKASLRFLAIAALISLCGCINLSFGSRRPAPGPAVVMPSLPLNPSDAATVAEIDAAAKLSFDNARKESLGELARRPGISPVVQVHLVNVTYRSLSFDNAKVDLLRALIANPAFSDVARQAIVTQLDHLSFDTHKQEVLRLLNQRVTTG